MSLSTPPAAKATNLVPAIPALLRTLGDNPFHSDGDLLGLGFAPDGTLWSIEEPGTLRQWDVHSARQLNWYPLDDLALQWSFSPGCRWVASSADDITLWEVSTGSIQAVLTPLSWVNVVAFDRSERHLASGHDDGQIRLWDLTTAELKLEFTNPTPRPISALAFSPDGRLLAAASEDKLIRLWDVASGELRGVLTGHTDRIPALVWHPTLPRLISAGWDTTARVWDVQTCEPIILLNSHSAQVHVLAMHPNGDLLATADSGRAIRIWDLQTFRELRVWPEQSAEINCLHFAPDGQRLACGGTDRQIHIRDIREQLPPSGEPEKLAVRTVVAVSPDGQRIFNVSEGSSLRSWDVDGTAAGQPLQGAGALRTMASSPDGKWIAASLLARGTGATLGLWDATSGERRALLEGQRDLVTALAFSPDSRLLASASYQSSDVWLWETQTGEPNLLIPNAVEGCSIEALAFAGPDRLLVGGIDWLATGGSDGATVLWDLTARKPIRTLPGGTTAIAIHPDRKHFASLTLQQTVRVATLTDEEVLEIEVPSEILTALAYSPDGRWLAVASEDHLLRLYDAETHKLLAQTILDTQVLSLTFAPDSATLFTGNANTSCYHLSVDRLLHDRVLL